MRTRLGGSLCGCVAMVGMAISHVSAHDPYEVTVEGRLGSDELALLVTMARSTADEVAGDGTARGVLFEPSEFNGRRKAFEAAAPRLFKVDEDGRPIQPSHVDVGLGREFDIEFRLVYPLVPGKTLRLDATHIRRLPAEGFGAAVTVSSPGSGDVSIKLLTTEDPVMEIGLPSNAAAESSR